MSGNELQQEEREVLSSIYDGDDCFKEITLDTFQYKYGESDTPRSFLVELKWGQQYPDELPQINMDTFYNKHLGGPLKERIVKLINDEAEQYLGMSMTYSLFEFIKEKFDELILEQPEDTVENTGKPTLPCSQENEQEVSQKAPKKEQLSKAQKRRQWNRVDNKGEKPRGWNWIDVVKHLSQTGPKEPTATTS